MEISESSYEIHTWTPIPLAIYLELTFQRRVARRSNSPKLSLEAGQVVTAETRHEYLSQMTRQESCRLFVSMY